MTVVEAHRGSTARERAPSPGLALLGRGEQRVLGRLGQELLETVDGVVGEIALGVARGSGGPAAVVLDGHAPIGERVAQPFDGDRVEAHLFGDPLEL